MIAVMHQMNAQTPNCTFIIVDERFRLTESGVHEHSKYAVAMSNLVNSIVVTIDLALICDGTMLLQLCLSFPSLRGGYQLFSDCLLRQAIFPVRNHYHERIFESVVECA